MMIKINLLKSNVMIYKIILINQLSKCKLNKNNIKKLIEYYNNLKLIKLNLIKKVMILIIRYKEKKKINKLLINQKKRFNKN